MNFKDLEVRQKVNIDVTWGVVKHTFESSVRGKNEDGILVSPFLLNGNPVEFDPNRIKEFSFDLSCIEPETNKRVEWKNIDINSVEVKGEINYVIKFKAFSQTARDGERRANERILVNTPGSITLIKDEREIAAMVHDLSDNGISFVVAKGVRVTSQPVEIDYSPEVEGKSFHIVVNARIVRKQETDAGLLCGCTMSKSSPDLMFYIFEKRLNERLQKKRQKNANDV